MLQHIKTIILDNYTKLFDEIKEQIESITGDKLFKYGKDFLKIKFKTNDDLPYNKMINIPVCVLITVFLKKIMNIIHKFCYMIVLMSTLILQICKVR